MVSIAALARRIRRFHLDHAGVSAVEFALILPVMLVIYLGGNEFGNALTINRKVTHVTSTVADLVAQSKSISNADMTNILNAAQSIMTPYPVTSMTMRVSLIKIDADKVATVQWSDARHIAPRVAGTTVTLPAGVLQASTWIVMSEVVYPFQPEIGYMLTGTINLDQTFYIRPRQAPGAIGRVS
jgi:Flp pilus assembly protein TadG